jgi:hypothetical protein
VTKWCCEFSDVHDEQRSSKPSFISHDLQKLKVKFAKIGTGQ